MANTKKTPRKAANMDLKETRKNISEELKRQAREIEKALEEPQPSTSGLQNTIKASISTRCDLCNKVFKNEKTLKAHNSYKHAPTSEIYACNLCFKTFTRKDTCFRHFKNKHDIEKPEPENYTMYTAGPRENAVKPKTWVPPAECLTEEDFAKYKNPKFRIVKPNIQKRKSNENQEEPTSKRIKEEPPTNPSLTNIPEVISPITSPQRSPARCTPSMSQEEPYSPPFPSHPSTEIPFYYPIEENGQTTIVIPSTSEILKDDLNLSSSSESSISSSDSEDTQVKKIMNISLKQGIFDDLDLTLPSRDDDFNPSAIILSAEDALAMDKECEKMMEESDFEKELAEGKMPTDLETLDKLIVQKQQEILEFMAKFK